MRPHLSTREFNINYDHHDDRENVKKCETKDNLIELKYNVSCIDRALSNSNEKT